MHIRHFFYFSLCLFLLPFTVVANSHENRPFIISQGQLPEGYYVSGESTFYRGISKKELDLLNATGEDVSYFTRKNGAQKTIDFLDSLGPRDLVDLISDHAETSNGYIGGKLFRSPLISVTKDIRVAADFAGEKGYILVVKAKGAIQNIGGEGREWEFLIPGSIGKEEIIGVLPPKEVANIRYTSGMNLMNKTKEPFNFKVHDLSEFASKKNRAGFIAIPSKNDLNQGGFKRAAIPRHVVTDPSYPIVKSTADTGIQTFGRRAGMVVGIAGTIMSLHDISTTSVDERVVKNFIQQMRQCITTLPNAPDEGLWDALKDQFPTWAMNLGMDDTGRMIMGKDFDEKFAREFADGIAYIKENCPSVWNGIKMSPKLTPFRQGVLEWLGRIPEIHGELKTEMTARPTSWLDSLSWNRSPAEKKKARLPLYKNDSDYVPFGSY